jgi:hypothetical protein
MKTGIITPCYKDEIMNTKVIKSEEPNFDDLIDKDILDRFKDSNVFYGDIINAQLIKTNKELIEAIKSNSL